MCEADQIVCTNKAYAIFIVNLHIAVLFGGWIPQNRLRSYLRDYHIMLASIIVLKCKQKIMHNIMRCRYYLAHVRMQTCEIWISRRLFWPHPHVPCEYMRNRHDINFIEKDLFGILSICRVPKYSWWQGTIVMCHQYIHITQEKHSSKYIIKSDVKFPIALTLCF